MEAPLNLKIPRANRHPIDLSDDVPIDLTTPQLKFKRRSSFFNIEKAPKEYLKKDEENQKRKEYIKKLEDERDNWRAIVNEKVEKTRERKAMKVIYDSAVLPEQRKNYLAGAVDFTEFVNNTEALCDDVYFYLKEVEWRDMQIECHEKLLEEKIVDAALVSILNTI